MKERYIPIRPGIEEHLIRGTISFFEFGIYVTVHMQANYSTGLWQGSAPRLLATAPRGANLRQIQRALEHLEGLGYLKSFRPNGARGNTAYLIDKFTVRSGARSGYRLNANLSISWKQAVYELVTEDDAEPVAESAPYQEVRSKERRERQKPAAKPAPPADPRFQVFFALAYESFAVKHNRKPLWLGKDRTGLKALLKSQGAASLPLERLRANWQNFLDSTEAFTAKQGDSLAYFCSNLDKFSDGPILAGKVKFNGDINAAVETTVRGFLDNTQVRH